MHDHDEPVAEKGRCRNGGVTPWIKLYLADAGVP
jgi:hypothetical protein